eukprot:g8507.t1
MSLLTHFLTNVRPDVRLQSRTSNGTLSKRLTSSATPRRPNPNGSSSIRRFRRVRVSARNESSGNANSSGLDVHKKTDTTRYQWLWHNYPPPTTQNTPLNFSDPEFDDDDDVLCSANEDTSSSLDASPSMTSSDSTASEGTALSPEMEFMSYARKLPRAQVQGVDLMESEKHQISELDEVYVLLFGVGEASTEGIYSLRSYCTESGLHKETIVCFESFNDAVRFSGLLEATMPHLSTVHTIKALELVQFCNDSGYACRLELEGSNLTPPEFNVGVTDWERSMRLRQGHYEVLDAEPDREVDSDEETGSKIGGPSMKQETKIESIQETRFPDLAHMKLDDVREMLERLLPDD